MTVYLLYAQHTGVMRAASLKIKKESKKPYVPTLLRLKWYGIDNKEEKAIKQSVIALESLVDCLITKGDPKTASKLGEHADVLKEMSFELKRTKATRTTMSYN